MNQTFCKTEKAIVNVLSLHNSALNHNYTTIFHGKSRTSQGLPTQPVHSKPKASCKQNKKTFLHKVEDFPYWLNHIRTVSRKFPGFLVVELFRHGKPGDYTDRVVAAHFQCANDPKVNLEINSIIASTIHPMWIGSFWKDRTACQNLEDIKLIFSKKINVEYLLKLETRMQKDPQVTIDLMSHMYMMVFQEPPTNKTLLHWLTLH